ncbi:MAG: RNA polymerase sigma factor [Pirellula sp.]|jgi:RNA polymerase sigma factor (sigma-70 family)|nr:RNA polymerase sigma factor [Pirellula sp.]
MSALSPTHDQDLSPTLERIRLGDHSGFDEIYNHFIDDVRRGCRRQLGWQDRCEQYEDDLAQEVMVTLWQSLKSFSNICDQRGDRTCDFIFLVIRRLIFEQGVNRGKHNKRQKRQRSVPLPVLYAELTRSHDTGNDQDAIDARDALQIALDRVSGSKIREIIIRKLRGESNQEIALGMQLSSRSIRRLLADSKSHLKEFVNA